MIETHVYARNHSEAVESLTLLGAAAVVGYYWLRRH